MPTVVIKATVTRPKENNPGERWRYVIRIFTYCEVFEWEEFAVIADQFCTSWHQAHFMVRYTLTHRHLYSYAHLVHGHEYTWGEVMNGLHKVHTPREGASTAIN